MSMDPQITAVALEADDVEAAEAFYTALGLSDRVRVRPAHAPSEGFRGFTLSPLVADPRQADAFVEAAVRAGGTVIKPPKKSLWGYGGSVRAPDGSIWTVASSQKNPPKGSTDAPPLVYEDLVLLLGVEDVKASKEFYVQQGLRVGKSYGSKYVEFDLPGSPVQLALNGRKATAKNAGVDAAGSGSHRLVVLGGLGPLTDPEGHLWEDGAAGG